MRKTWMYLLASYLLSVSAYSLSPDDLKVNINGTIQSYASYEQNDKIQPRWDLAFDACACGQNFPLVKKYLPLPR